MKKSLLGLLLMVAMVIPALAIDKGAIELDAKAGLVFSPKLTQEAEGTSITENQKMTYSLGIDGFYYVDSAIALGLGVEHIFASKFDNVEGDIDPKFGTTNIFVQGKYVVETENDIFNNIYPIVQLGYGILDADFGVDEITFKNGLYWGIGLGTTIKENFLVEIFYSCNYGTMEIDDPSAPSVDTTFKSFRLKVGYKFAI